MPGSSRAIRAITLDLDDTLWPSMPTILRAEARAHVWLAAHAPAVASLWPVERLRELRLSIYNAHPEMRHDYLRIRRLSMHTAFEEAGVSGAEAHEQIERALDVFMTARNEVDLYPEVLASLARLSQRYALASLTNGNADVARIGLAHHFKAVISAHEHGVAKPDAALFHMACAQLGCAPDEVVHVGDDVALDVHGAASAGMHAVWMNRTAAMWSGPDSDVPPMVTSMIELEAWLDTQVR